jgi:hypothetical protein
MLERCTELSFSKLQLQPFDQATLAAILIRAGQLSEEGVEDTDLCELDSHLQPWDKDNIWVYGDFCSKALRSTRGGRGGMYSC